HLLLALCADPAATKILRACGTDFGRLTSELEVYFTQQLQPNLEDGAEPKQTPSFWRVLQRAAMHVHGAGKDTMDGGNVLVSLFPLCRERESPAVYLLEQQGVTRLDVLRYVAHGVSKVETGRGRPLPDEDEELAEGDDDKERDPLATYTQNLVERARKGGIDP